jgi:putative IMPACT (imprinted ancient) family translation regulator
MLEVLRHQQLEGVLATVVRYFGGVKLGPGGLLRAYTDAIAQALLTAEKLTLHRTLQLGCRVPYALEGRVRRELHDAGLLSARSATERPSRWSSAWARMPPQACRRA